GGELHRVAGPPDLVGVLVHHEVGELEDGVVDLDGLGATQDGADARHDLGQAERLGDPIVATDGQPRHLVLHRVFGGEEQHGRADAVAAQPAGDGDAVEVGKHDVEHDQVGPEVSRF